MPTKRQSIEQSQLPPTYPCLWKKAYKDTPDASSSFGSVDESSIDRFVVAKYTVRPKHRSMKWFSSQAIVVLQEFFLTSFYVIRHCLYTITTPTSSHHDVSARQSSSKLDPLWETLTMVAIFLALFLSVLYAAQSDPQQQQQQDRKTKVLQRSTDSAVLAVLLRFLASLLRSLTASYSSDTVQALAMMGFLLHMLTCDYSYARGKNSSSSSSKKRFPILQNNAATTMLLRQSERPVFRGGTISLNAALFSTTLLVSRLQDSMSTYFFVSLAIILFAFYPVTRHAISTTFPAHKSLATWLISLFMGVSTFCSLMLLQDHYQHQQQNTRPLSISTYHVGNHHLMPAFFGMSFMIGLLYPAWRYIAQSAKVSLKGPWDIPSPACMQLDLVGIAESVKS